MSSLYVHWGRKRNSWHIVDHEKYTLCGRFIGWLEQGRETRDTLPAAKSCETCLRLARRRDEAA